MFAPFKILVLNDDCLGANTVYDAVQSQGFRVLNEAITKEIYQRHHSYNRLLNSAAVLSQQLCFEPSDFFAPCIRLSPELLSELHFTTDENSNLPVNLVVPVFQHAIELGAFDAQAQAQSKVQAHDLAQGQAQAQAKVQAQGWAQSQVQSQNQDQPAQLYRKVQANQAGNDKATDRGTGEETYELQRARFQPDELYWWDKVLFFTLDEYTNLDLKFVERNFDGVFFFCHHKLGSKVLPESLLSLLLSKSLPDLWLFNVEFDPQQMLLNLKLSRGEPSTNLLQAMQSVEFQQVQAFLDELLPKAIEVSCLNAATAQQLQAYYSQSSKVNLSINSNVYQCLHYVNQIRSLCKSAVGLNSELLRTCVLSPQANIAEFAKQKLTTLKSAIVKAITADGESLPGFKQTRKASKFTPENDGPESRVLESTISEFPKQLFGCVVDKSALSHVRRCASSSLNTDEHEPGQNAVEAQQAENSTPYQVSYVPHIVLSSQHFHFNKILGMEICGVRLILQMLATYPEAEFSLILNDGVYSWLEPISAANILWQDLAELPTRDEFVEAAKNTGELLSSAVQSRVVNNLRQHILASFADETHWPWTKEQRHNLERVVARFASPLESKIFCYQNLSNTLLQLPIDLVCSDIQSDLVSASARGLATLELVETPDTRYWGVKLHYKDYILEFANACDFEHGSMLRFILPQLENNDIMQERVLRQQIQVQQDVQQELSEISALTLQERTEQAALLSPVSNHGGLGAGAGERRFAQGLGSGHFYANAETNRAGAEFRVRENAEVNAGVRAGVRNSAQAEAGEVANQAMSQGPIVSGYGLRWGMKLYWRDVMQDIHFLRHVGCNAPLELQIRQCFEAHIKFLRHMGQSLQPRLQARSEHMEHSSAVKLAQLSNYTYAKRYNLHYQALRYFAQLAHATGFGDGATLAQNLTDCDLATAFMERYKHQPDLVKLMPQLASNNQWPVFKPLSLSVLSFGCSRGDEIFDLLPLFNGQRLTGIDISESAIITAQKLLQGMEHVSLADAPAEFAKLYAVPQLLLGSDQTTSPGSTSGTIPGATLGTIPGVTQAAAPGSTQAAIPGTTKVPGANLGATKATGANPGGLPGAGAKAAEIQGGDNTSQEIEEIEAQTAGRIHADIKAAVNKLTNGYLGATSKAIKEQHLVENIAKLARMDDEAEFKEKCSALEPQLVKYLGAMGLVNFASTQDFFNLYLGSATGCPQYDVVTVMTVLCRHPETLQVSNAKGIYEFADFYDTLQVLHRLVKKGGLLCIFNSNYSLMDTPLASKYVGLFPQLPEQAVNASKVMQAANGAGTRPGQATGQSGGNAGARGTTNITAVEAATNANAPAQDLLPEADEMELSSLARCFFAPQGSKQNLPYPELLRETLLKTSVVELWGHVALFKPDGKLYPQGRMGCMSIFYKLEE